MERHWDLLFNVFNGARHYRQQENEQPHLEPFREHCWIRADFHLHLFQLLSCDLLPADVHRQHQPVFQQLPSTFSSLVRSVSSWLHLINYLTPAHECCTDVSLVSVRSQGTLFCSANFSSVSMCYFSLFVCHLMAFALSSICVILSSNVTDTEKKCQVT